MDRVLIQDEYQQNWIIYEDDSIYPEALEAVKTSNGQPVVWPIAKLTANRGYGWWTVFNQIDELEHKLEEAIPNPNKRLIDIDREYTPQELRDLIQKFGSYLSNLTHTEALIEAQCHALKESFKSGMSVAIANSDSKATTVAAKESEVLANNELFRHTKRMQINNEAALILVQGWRKSYENAYNTVSRLITLMLGELETSRLT